MQWKGKESCGTDNVEEIEQSAKTVEEHSVAFQGCAVQKTSERSIKTQTLRTRHCMLKH